MTASTVCSCTASLSRRHSAHCPLSHLKWPLLSSPPPAPHPPLCPISPSFASVLFSRLSFYFCSYLLLVFCSRGASEGKMVVLALAIGVAEQDDFANIPDLQETAQAAPPAANQEPPPEKRYRIMYESARCMWENGVQMKVRYGCDIGEEQEMVSEPRWRKVVLLCRVLWVSHCTSVQCATDLRLK